MADLINDLYNVYDANPEYCFLSMDVVRMFDEIPMSSVLSVISLLDAELEHGFVNKYLLMRLVKMDCNVFNYFRFFDLSMNGGKGIVSI